MAKQLPGEVERVEPGNRRQDDLHTLLLRAPLRTDRHWHGAPAASMSG
jgi:hypothetical protein